MNGGSHNRESERDSRAVTDRDGDRRSVAVTVATVTVAATVTVTVAAAAPGPFNGREYRDQGRGRGCPMSSWSDAQTGPAAPGRVAGSSMQPG